MLIDLTEQQRSREYIDRMTPMEFGSLRFESWRFILLNYPDEFERLTQKEGETIEKYN